MKTKLFFLGLCPILAGLGFIQAAQPTITPKPSPPPARMQSPMPKPSATPARPATPKASPTPTPLNDEEQIRRIEKEWLDAILKRDGAYLEDLEAPDFLVTGPNGRTLTKAEDIKDTTSGETVFEKMEMEKQNVRLYDNTAVVNGLASVTTRSKGKSSSGKYAWTDVFVKMNGNWKAVSAQVTAYGPK